MGVQTGLRRQPSREVSIPAVPAPSHWPEVPVEVERLIRAGVVSSRLVFPEHGPSRELVVWRPPVIGERRDLEVVERHLDEVERCLEPMDRASLLSRILALLSHFRVDPQPAHVEMMIADDWAEDLGDYPPWAVEAAARQWRRTRKFKPQIAEMIALCEAECGDKRVHRDRLRSLITAARRQSLGEGREWRS